MTRPALRALALALPLFGLAASWGWTHVRAQQGTEWDVPVEGYDPRDLLRGHYITYRYDWPGLKPGDYPGEQEVLCLEGPAPTVTRAFIAAENACENPIVDTEDFGVDRGILYVPQDKASNLEAKLRNPAQQGMIRIRVRNDGHITPLRMTFRPRPDAASPR